MVIGAINIADNGKRVRTNIEVGNRAVDACWTVLMIFVLTLSLPGIFENYFPLLWEKAK
jgi:hypothetical protein